MSNYLQASITTLFPTTMFLWTLPTQILIICQCLAITVPRRAGPPRRSNKSVNPPPEIPEERVEGAILIRSMITRRRNWRGGYHRSPFLPPYCHDTPSHLQKNWRSEKTTPIITPTTHNTNPSKSLITADPLGVGSCSETATARPSDTVFRTMSREQIQCTSPVPGRVCNGDLHSVRRAWNTREILKHIGIIHL